MNSKQKASDLIAKERVIAVLVIDDVQTAVPVAESLMTGGITSVELALRTPCAMDAILAIKSQLPEMTVGAGTVLEKQQLQWVKEAGVDFAFAPGLNSEVVKCAYELNLPFIPGICTPSDIEKAIHLGCNILKFFPSEPMGGMRYLKSLSNPYDHLNLKYIPLGGVSEDNFLAYFDLPSVIAVGGSWIATKKLIAEGNYKEITHRARKATKLLQGDSK